ncbi:MAG: lipid A deacylase LpxR family protein [Pseudomonadota bacterium]
MKSFFKALSLAGTMLLFTTPSFAEDALTQDIQNKVRSDKKRNVINLSVENDLFGGGTDRYYTSGVRLSWLNTDIETPQILKSVSDRTPFFERNETSVAVYSIGHNLYTPEDITIEANQDNDRPWAAWLYASAGITTLQGNHVDEFEATIGVVGPEALGKPIQRFVHSTFTGDDPRGWKNQLDFEPGIIISAQRRWPGALKTKIDAKISDYALRMTPHINFSLGNIYTYAGSGFTIAFSPFKDRFQDTPPRVRPAMPGTGYFAEPSHSFTWQLFAGAEGRAMARNIFLDGNTFSDSHSVDKKYFVADLNAGAAVTWRDYRVSYTVNYRTEEFRGQSEPSIFGSLNLSTRF